MKEARIISIIIILLLISILYIGYNLNDTIKDLKGIDEIELKLDSIQTKKDSIRSIVDSTHVKIITNEKHYQEKVNTIINQPDSFSESFTRQYLCDYASTHGYSIIRTPKVK